jgi:hypothetical protein
MSKDPLDFEQRRFSQEFEDFVKAVSEKTIGSMTFKLPGRVHSPDLMISKEGCDRPGCSHSVRVPLEFIDAGSPWPSFRYRLPEQSHSYREVEHEIPGSLRFDLGDLDEPMEEERKPVDPDADRRLEAIRGAISRSRKLGEQVESSIEVLKKRPSRRS